MFMRYCKSVFEINLLILTLSLGLTFLEKKMKKMKMMKSKFLYISLEWLNHMFLIW